MILNFPIVKEAGVYMLTNTHNNKRYIGSSNNIRTRIRRHNTDFLKSQNNEYMQKDFDASHDFTVEILELMPSSTRQERSKKEQIYTLKYRTNEREYGYNIYIGGKAYGKLNSNYNSKQLAKITEEQARQIFELLKSGMSAARIRDKLQVSYSTIDGIKEGRTWKSITGGVKLSKSKKRDH